jgi:hypothetical protein
MASHNPFPPDSEKCSYSEVSHTNSRQMIHIAITTPVMMPANLNIATLFPAAAIRPNRPADPLRDVPIEEKVSDYKSISPNPTLLPFQTFTSAGDGVHTYRIVNNILRPRVVVDVNCDVAQGSDLGRELREAGVVLALALVGVRHGGGLVSEWNGKGKENEGEAEGQWNWFSVQFHGSAGCWVASVAGWRTKALCSRGCTGLCRLRLLEGPQSC